MVRLPIFAGSFYPADPIALRAQVQGFIENGVSIVPEGPLRALVAPHAGYIYSGPIAGSAYKTLFHTKQNISHVILLGPSHRVGFEGYALSEASHFRTPLGDLALDPEMRKFAQGFPGAHLLEAAHAQEHSLEVQMPFVQVVLEGVPILPVVVGQADVETVAGLLTRCLDRYPEALVVVSSDLSHYLPYREAQEVDMETAHQACMLDPCIQPDQACGCHAWNGLIRTAHQRGWSLKSIDVRNSGDTCGDRSRVVGYGAFAVW